MAHMAWLSSRPDHEKQLEHDYVLLLQTCGLPPPAAGQMVREMIDTAKEISAREGSRIPANFGDVLIASEATDARTKELLEAKRREGVRDEDIRWWWNLPDLDRRMFLLTDDHFHMAAASNGVRTGLTIQEAVALSQKTLPIYGDPRDTSKLAGDNRPLPLEIRDRVNRYRERQSALDPASHKRDRDAASSFNALVRAAMRRREL
jgi:hypothetical protein